jgi:ketosteroid isomerase-like protein
MSTVTSSSGTDSIKDVANAMFRTWADNDFARARALIAAGSTAWLAHAASAQGAQPNSGTSFGLDRWLDLLEGIVKVMPQGLEMTVHRMIAEDEWVAADVESVGPLPDGRVYNMRYTFWLHIRDGQVHELRQFFDTKYGEQFFLQRHFTEP